MKPRYYVAILTGLVCASSAAADILVVRSSGPSAKTYPAGKSIPEGGKITLKASDTLVVLDGRGTRTLRGPGSFAAGAPSKAAPAPSAIAGIVAGAPQRRSRVGAVRSVSTTPRSPTIWHVDIAKSSTICLADRNGVTLWRADATQPIMLRIAGPGGRLDEIAWAKNEATLIWPASMTIAEGAEYRMSWGSESAPTLLSFKWLPAKPAGIEDMAQSLIRNQCQAQLDLLIETFKQPDEEAAVPS